MAYQVSAGLLTAPSGVCGPTHTRPRMVRWVFFYASVFIYRSSPRVFRLVFCHTSGVSDIPSQRVFRLVFFQRSVVAASQVHVCLAGCSLQGLRQHGLYELVLFLGPTS